MAKKKRNGKTKPAAQPKPSLPNPGTLVTEDPHKLLRISDDYFANADLKNEPYTLSGLGLDLGLPREELLNFNGECEGQRAVIYYSLQRIQERAEQLLASGTGSTAHTFFLKSNFGWQDLTKIALGSGPTGDDPLETRHTIDPSKLSLETLVEIMEHRPKREGN